MQKKAEPTFATFTTLQIGSTKRTLGLDKDGREEIEFFEMQSPFFAEKKGHEKGGQIPDILWLGLNIAHLLLVSPVY